MATPIRFDAGSVPLPETLDHHAQSYRGGEALEDLKGLLAEVVRSHMKDEADKLIQTLKSDRDVVVKWLDTIRASLVRVERALQERLPSKSSSPRATQTVIARMRAPCPSSHPTVSSHSDKTPRGWEALMETSGRRVHSFQSWQTRLEATPVSPPMQTSGTRAKSLQSSTADWDSGNSPSMLDDLMTLDVFPQDREQTKSPISDEEATAPTLEVDSGIQFNTRCGPAGEDGDTLALQKRQREAQEPSSLSLVSPLSSNRISKESATLLDGTTPQVSNTSELGECKMSPIETEECLTTMSSRSVVVDLTDEPCFEIGNARNMLVSTSNYVDCSSQLPSFVSASLHSSQSPSFGSSPDFSWEGHHKDHPISRNIKSLMGHGKSSSSNSAAFVGKAKASPQPQKRPYLPKPPTGPMPVMIVDAERACVEERESHSSARRSFLLPNKVASVEQMDQMLADHLFEMCGIGGGASAGEDRFSWGQRTAGGRKSQASSISPLRPPPLRLSRVQPEIGSPAALGPGPLPSGRSLGLDVERATWPARGSKKLEAQLTSVLPSLDGRQPKEMTADISTNMSTTALAHKVLSHPFAASVDKMPETREMDPCCVHLSGGVDDEAGPTSTERDGTKDRPMKMSDSRTRATAGGRAASGLDQLRVEHETILVMTLESPVVEPRTPGEEGAVMGMSLFLPTFALMLFGIVPLKNGILMRIYDGLIATSFAAMFGYTLQAASTHKSIPGYYYHLSTVVTVTSSGIGLVCLRRSGILGLLGPRRTPLVAYAHTWGFLPLWHKASRSRLGCVVGLYVFGALSRWGISLYVYGRPMFEGFISEDPLLMASFLCSQAFLYSLMFCHLHVCSCLELSIDHFCVRLFEKGDLHGGIGEWNVLQALLRRAAHSVEACFLMTCTGVLAVVLLTGLELFNIRQRDYGEAVLTSGPVLSLWAGWVLPLAILVFYGVFRAAAITEKCNRVPALVNSWSFAEDTIDSEKQYAVQYIMQSAAGFYIKGVRMSATWALKLSYLFGALVFTTFSQVFLTPS